MGNVHSIYIAAEAKAPMVSLPFVQCEANAGLVGDRYHAGCGSFNRPQCDPTVREVTLMALEAVSLCNTRLGRAFDAGVFRRNIVTEGVELSALIGQHFRIADVIMRGVRTAPPCRLLSRITGADMMLGLRGIGGIRAVIVQGGAVSTGDKVAMRL